MWLVLLGHTLSQSVINKCSDLGMNNLESLVALLGTCRGGCCWINSHKESGSRLLSRSTAKGPSHQKLMSYLDHAVSPALYWENTAGLGRKEPQQRQCVCVLCDLCVSYRSTEGDWQLRENKAVKMVIMHVQLLSHCFGANAWHGSQPLFLASNVKTKPGFDSQCNTAAGPLRRFLQQQPHQLAPVLNAVQWKPTISKYQLFRISLDNQMLKCWKDFIKTWKSVWSCYAYHSEKVDNLGLHGFQWRAIRSFLSSF